MPKITSESWVDPGGRAKVSVDPYARNVLADDGYQLSVVRPKGTPPKLFSNGEADLPLFTASGIDPQLLLKLPAACRHYVAAEPDPAAVHGLFEQLAGNPHATLAHQGWAEAVSRARRWAIGDPWKLEA